MKKLLLTALITSLCACQKVVPDKIEQTQSGKIDVNINLGLIDQLERVCTDYYANYRFDTEEDHDHAVAACIFDHLKGISATAPTDISNFNNQYCQPNSDLSSFTPEQVAQIQAACTALGL